MPFTPVSGGSPTSPTPKPYAGGFTAVGAAAAAKEDEGGFGVFDFVGNVAEEAGAMVQGVGTLIGAGVHDLSSVAKEAATLGGAETDFVLDDIAMALPGAIAQDYNSRYGISKFAEGDIWGGLKAVLTGLYEHPLSAIGDALMVGTGAKLAAKAGLAGEALGSKILGPGSMEAVSLTGAGEGVTALGLSQNPVARLAQRKLYDVMTYGNGLSDKAMGVAGFGDAGTYIDRLSDTGSANRAVLNKTFAEATERPILRPGFSKPIEARGISKALSHLGLNVSDRTAQSTAAIREILTPDEVDKDLFVSGAMGTKAVALPDTIPSNASPVHFTPANEIDVPAGVGEAASPGLDTPALSAAVRDFKGNMRRDASIISPHDRTTTEANRVILLTTDPSDAANLARRYANDVGGTVEWRQNYAQVAGEADGASYVGIHYGVRSPDGQMHDVSIATPEMLEQQRAWSHMSLQADAQRARIAAATEEAGIAMRNNQGGAYEAAQREIIDAQEELAAIQAFNAHTFDYTRRVMNGGDYDPTLAALDKARYTIYNHATASEIGHGLTFRKAIDRSFGAIRAEKWSAFMRNIEQSLADTIEQGLASGAKKEDLINPIIANVEQVLGVNNPWTESMFRSYVDEVIPFETEDNLRGVLRTGEKRILEDGRALAARKTKYDPETGDMIETTASEQAQQIAKRLTDRLRSVTHESLVVNGEFPGMDWRSLMREQVEGGLPVPQYYPHIKAANATGDVVMMNTHNAKIPSIIEGETARMKKWGGWLYEQGIYERDPIKAYEQLFQQVAKHNEFRDAMNNLVQKYGRVVQEHELDAWNLRQQAEVLVSQKGLNGMIDSRTKLMTMTHEGVMRGDSLEDASVSALEALTDQALQSFAEGMKGDTIYALPRHVASQIKRAAKLQLPGTFNFYYDTASNLWKAQVLSLSPRWVINNTLGNLVFMGIRNPGSIRRFISELMPGAESRARVLLGDDVVDAIQKDFMHTDRLLPQSQRLATRAEKAGVDAGVRLAESSAQEWRAVKGIRSVSERVRAINTWIEDAARRGVAIDALGKRRIHGVAGRLESTRARLERIASEGIDNTDQYGSVIREVNATLGDYLTMSPVEGQIIRRYMMPFYAFYRHTAKFLARMPFEHPLKVKVLEQIDQIDRQMNPFMPDYLRGSTEIWDGMWMRFGGANPMNALTEGYWPSMTNPMLGLAIQRATGTNPFGQKWYPPPGSVVETAGGDKYAVMRDGDGRVTGIRQFDGEWQPPLYEALTAQAMPLAGMIFDPFDRAVAKRLIGPMTGVSYSDTYSPETEAYYQTNSYIEALKRAASSLPQ